MPASSGSSPRGVAEGGEVADEGQHQDQRPGRGLGHGEAVQHLAGLQPAQRLHGLLGDVGEDGVGAAEGHHRHLGEEHGHRGRRRSAGAEDRHQQQRQCRPQAAPEQDHPRGARQRRPVCVDLLARARSRRHRPPARASGGGRTGRGAAWRRSGRSRPAPSTISGNGTPEEEDRDEGQRPRAPPSPGS